MMPVRRFVAKVEKKIRVRMWRLSRSVRIVLVMVM
jgi:hypothetical protein